MLKACQCEHVAHTAGRNTPNGNPGHAYNTPFLASHIITIPTVYGDYDVCRDCSEDCQAYGACSCQGCTRVGGGRLVTPKGMMCAICANHDCDHGGPMANCGCYYHAEDGIPCEHDKTLRTQPAFTITPLRLGCKNTIKQ